jgi:5-methylcytosine-specific restriction enzyme subunit McrC
VKTFSTVERQPASIPISDVVDPTGGIEIFPEVRERGYFDVDLRGGRLVVVGGKFIGHIPLNSRVLIDVRPKFGIGRLAQILERAREPLRCLHFYRRQYKTDDFVGLTIFEVLVKALVATTRTIISEGLLRNYESRIANTSSIRGRIQTLQTARVNHARGIRTSAICTYFELDADNALNRLIKQALWYSASHLVRLGSTQPHLREQLDELYEYFAAVPLDASPDVGAIARFYLETRKIPFIRSYYVEACETALAILNNSGLDLLGEGTDVRLSSFLVDMETVFENYVRNVIRDRQSDFNLTVLDGNQEGRGWLFADSNLYEAKPDLIVRNGAICLIGDCKYKTKLSEQDRYQVISHALSFGAPTVCAIIPAASAQESGLERVGRIGSGASAVEFFTYRVDLESADLGAEEARLVDAVFALCKSSKPPGNPAVTT